MLNAADVVRDSGDSSRSEFLSAKLDKLILQLCDSSSARRRSAAKQIGKLGDPAAGRGLLEALKVEVVDARTWETQYDMIIALGSCRQSAAVSFLKHLVDVGFKFDSLYGAVGDSIIRIALADDRFKEELRWCLRVAQPDLIDGAMKAMWDEEVSLDSDLSSQMVEYLLSQDPYAGVRYWAALAARRWKGEASLRFLEDCAVGPRGDVAGAARESLNLR
ncbi:HEAT repeat domain-containing protein [Kitasatospora sp. NPDC057936]|uniref:HEAT repeat domain-containing protein n=1 Tax=Kitasatospora sp. NPDC057936 TaxID=3346283 RepID=UPI0036DAA3C4